jgi:hypothetical protein
MSLHVRKLKKINQPPLASSSFNEDNQNNNNIPLLKPIPYHNVHYNE